MEGRRMIDMQGHLLDFEEWRDRVQANRARDLPEFHPVKQINAPPICIAASGPSLKAHMGSLKRMRKAGSVLMAVNRAYGVTASLNPDFAVYMDPREDLLSALEPKNQHTMFLLASQVHPSLFDALTGHNTGIWHVWCPGWAHLEDAPTRISPGGSHVGPNAIVLAYVLGFREMHLYGFDGCYRGGKKYARKETAGLQDEETVELMVAGRKWAVTPHLMVQATEFSQLIRFLQWECRIVFHGTGLLSTLWQQEIAA